MKLFVSIFSLALALVSVVNGWGIKDRESRSCPSTNCCMGQTSSIANLICLSYRHQTGFDYAMIGIGNGVVAVCSVYLDCQLGRKVELRVIEVLGIMVLLPSRYKLSDGKYEYGSNLWYTDLTTPGCPGYYKVENLPYTASASFNRAISPLPIADTLAYAIYESMFGEYACECNIFRDLPTGTDSSTGYSGPFYFSQSTVSVIGLQDTKCGHLFSVFNNSAVRFVNTYGVPDVDIEQLPTPIPNISPPIYREIVTARGYDTFPHCRDFTNTSSISEVLASYDYYVNCLDRYSGSKVATLYAQGFNSNCHQDGQCRHHTQCNTGSIASFCSIAFLPGLTDSINSGTPSQSAAGTVFWLLNGFCQNSIVENVLSYFL